MPKILEKNKNCPLYWNQKSHGISILIPENSIKYNDYTVFRFSLKMFLNFGSIWNILGLDTIYWEKPIYGIYTNELELEYTKIVYLLGLAKDVSLVSKEWARNCLQKTVENVSIDDEVYVEIVLFDQSLKEKFIETILTNDARFFMNSDIFMVVKN